MPFFEDANWDGTPSDVALAYSRIISMTASQIHSPTAQQIEDLEAIYQLNVNPFTRYFSNGSSLVEIVDETSINDIAAAALAVKADQSVVDAQIVLLSTALDRIAALEGANGPSVPSINTAVTISDTTPNVGDTLTAGGGTPAGGSSPYVAHYQWYITTVMAGRYAIPGWDFVTLSVIESMRGGQISVAKWVVDATGLPSVPRESALTTAVGGTQANAVTLSGLPASQTTLTSASIGWTQTGTGTVFCRLDAYTPAAAPNPFVLGSGTPLSVGAHKVDFYVSANGSGTDIDPAVPITTYSWTIQATPTVTLSGLPTNGTTSTGASIGWTLSPTGSSTVYWRRDGQTAVVATTNPIVLSGLSVASHTVDFYTSANGTGSDNVLRATYTWAISASGVIPLAQLTFPSDIDVNGASGSYDGVNAKVVSAVTRLAPYVDASGVTMDVHRIVQGAGNQRAECLWIGTSGAAQNFVMGHEYWYSFVVERVSGETQPTSATDDGMLIQQIHWNGYGATQPEVALFEWGQSDWMRWRVSGSSTTPGNYADHGGTGTFNWHDTGEAGYTNPYVTAGETRPAAGVKWRYAVRYKPGWAAEHDKIVQIWRGKPGEDMVNITTDGIYTGVNEYNDNNSGLSIPGYARKGLYKWDGSTWNATPLAYRMSRLYCEENTTGASSTAMLAMATEAVAWAR